jgi:hypothetical protein
LRSRRWTPYLALLVLAGPLVFGGGRAAARVTPPTVMHIYSDRGASLPASLQALHAGDGLAADSVGNLYVGYEGNNFLEYVAAFDSQGRFLRDWQVGSGVHVPKVAVGGPDGLVYVAPSADPETIEIFKPDGSFVRQFGAGSISTDSGDIEVDGSGNVYVSSAAVTGRPDRFVVRFDPAGNATRTWVPQPGGRANEAGAIAVAPDGSIYEVGLPTVTVHSTLTHLASDGTVLSSKDLDQALGEGEYKDVDYVNGHLYLSGQFSTATGPSHLHALAVLGPDETVQDQILGLGDQVAVSGTHVWVTGLDTSPGSTQTAASGEFSVGGIDEVPIENNDKLGKFIDPSGSCGGAEGKEYGNIPAFIVSKPGPNCSVSFVNEGTPCRRPDTKGKAVAVYVGGKQVKNKEPFSDAAQTYDHQPGGWAQVGGDAIQTGSVIMSWSCTDAAGKEVEHHYEWKGSIYRLGDPSGAVYDARTGRLLKSATVRIEYSAAAGGPFGAPPALTTLPVLDRELTAADGRFRWDVADGYWRLVVSAVGYHSLTSKVYKVPPEVTGIRLLLRPNPAEQRNLFDPAGRVGKLKIGMRASARLRVAGLRIRIVHGHIRSITIRSKRYRTATGIRLGSARHDFERAFPHEVMRALVKAKKAAPKTFQVKKATFTVKGVVVEIKLGR